MNFHNYRRPLFLLILVSALVRSFLAAFVELGNDEAYYVIFARFPALSYFDHPPMVGWIIQLFTGGLTFRTEFFIRLGAIVIGSVNTLLVYRIGRCIKDERMGYLAAVLYTASLYCSVVAGTFILPDTPQTLFWLLALHGFLHALSEKGDNGNVGRYLFLAGLATGLALLSKYTAIFLWTGAMLYILVYKRTWLKKSSLYLSVVATVILFTPVIWWNIKNQFISLSYHSGRAGLAGMELRPDYLLTELAGEFFYNNPVNFILILLATTYFFRHRDFPGKEKGKLLLFIALPPIALFLLLSLFRPTLPHWTGPAYMTLIFLAASWLGETGKGKFLPWPAMLSLGFAILVAALGFLQVNYGIVTGLKTQDKRPEKLGSKDVSLDLYGWRQTGYAFQEILQKQGQTSRPGGEICLVATKWFTAAKLDQYVARRVNARVLAMGRLDEIHEYARINRLRGGFTAGMDAWYLTTSREYYDPARLKEYFETIIPMDTIQVERSGKSVMNVFVYYLENLNKLPPDVSVQDVQ
jgi:4-amino-4-deoxy-L-arabinose transferase-like glycosyltransferase